MAQFLIRGDEYLKAHPSFKLVGRDDELKRLSAILMRSRSNSVLLVGPGGVGCTALCMGLQALKKDEHAPFDIVSKRFFWLDVDGLFSSGDQAAENTMFQAIMRELERTPDSVLVLEDTRDFIEAARNGGCPHFINALTQAVKKGRTQIILEARDDDLDMVLKSHSDMRECLTMMDLEEPRGEALLAIVSDAAASLARFHGIEIAQDAVLAAIELTNNYRTRDIGLSRAQPERGVTLLDRSLSSYRLLAHEKPLRLRDIEETINRNNGATTDQIQEYHRIDTEWRRTQEQIKALYRSQRDGEIALLQLEDELTTQQRAEADGTAAVEASGKRSFKEVRGLGGFESKEVRDIKGRLDALRAAVSENARKFSEVTQSINHELKLDRPLVLREFSRISGIAADKLDQDERIKLIKLGDNLRARIFGQDHVVDLVADGVRVFKLGRRNGKRPLAFMFSGPSGVGKTEMAKQLAAQLLDDEQALTRFDMSEYMEKHAVAKMIGATPGYEGFDVGGILTNTMRKNPKRVILFDEVEKAHPDVFNIFLQILDDGRLTDNVGRTVSFRDAVIVMTTNAPPDELNSTFRSEFLNRFNGRQNIVRFNSLDIPSMEKIVRREISQIDAAYKDQGIRTVVSDADVNAFCESQYDPLVGARGLPGYIQVSLEPIIVKRLLADENARGTLNVTWDAENKRFTPVLKEERRAA